MKKQLISTMLCTATLLRVLPFSSTANLKVAAAESYPEQKFLMGIYNTDCNVNSSGTGIAAENNNGTLSEKWSLNFVSDGVFEIVSTETGNILTENGSSVSLGKDVDGANQRWRIDGVQKDFDGYYLYYKITSNADGKALTFSENSCSFTLSDYKGDGYQKYKINLDGLEGFAANAMCSEGEKACTIGGLFGQTVYASNATELINYLKDTKPLTIVVNGTIDMQPHQKTRIRDNKSLVGAYSGGKIIDCEMRTNNEYGNVGDEPSDNIVIRNIDFLAKQERGRILIQIWSSRQIWIDHCTFNSELSRDRDEVGKFIWLNTPYDNYMDKKDRLRSIDYITISYCQFRNRFWTVAYGTQNDEITRDRTTLLYNWWDQCVRRCPQLGNGNMHIYNNYYSGNDNGNDQSTDQIIGGDGCNIVSENCRFQSITRGHEIIGGGGNQPYRDTGSYYAEKSNSTPKALNYKVSNTSKWYPNQSNYGYELLDAYNTKGTDTKDFCTKYSGHQTKALQYITDSDLKNYIQTAYASPFLKHCDFSKRAAVMDTSVNYMFRNVGSGLYLEVADGKAENGANVQQGKSVDKSADTWTLADAGNGYYHIISKVGDGKTYYLDLSYGSTENGTNIGIWTDDGTEARLFKFLDNGDGSYTITTKASADGSCVAVNNDSTKDGENIIQWQCNGKASQKWEAIIKLELLNGKLIKNLDRLNANYADKWSIKNGLENGSNLFGDRDVTYVDLPEMLLGAEYIQTPCDAKNLNGDMATFEASEDITVYVGIDSRVENSPNWLNSFTKTTLTFKNSSNVSFILYAKDVKAGETIELGANEQSTYCVNYTVIATKMVENAVMGDANGDGEFTVADVVMLQKWLLCQGTLENWQCCDFNEDSQIDLFDLCLMRRALLSKLK